MHRRILKSPSAGNTIVNTIGIKNGGTNATTAPQALTNLNAVPATQFKQPNGVAKLGSDGLLSSDQFPSNVGYGVNVSGDTSINTNQTKNYIITDYDAFKNYSLTPLSGTVSRTGDTISYTSPSSGSTCGFSINGLVVNLTLIQPVVNTPSIVSPSNGSVISSVTPTITGSAFSVSWGSDTFSVMHFDVATDVNFTNMHISGNTGATSVSLSTSPLNPSTTYYARIRYQGVAVGLSAWSSVISFTTAAATSIVAPTITTPANGSLLSGLETTLNTSAFSVSNGSDTFVHTEFQISTSNSFATIFDSTQTAFYNWTKSALTPNTTYYARARHLGQTLGYSAWSSTVSFTSANVFTFNPTVSSESYNYNLRNAAIDAGWNGVVPLITTITVNNFLGSTSTGTYAFDTGSPFPAGSQLTLVNNHWIVGCGGQGGQGGYYYENNGPHGTYNGYPGGHAMLLQYPITIVNNGVICAGGGGGGGGGAATNMGASLRRF